MREDEQVLSINIIGKCKIKTEITRNQGHHTINIIIEPDSPIDIEPEVDESIFGLQFIEPCAFGFE